MNTFKQLGIIGMLTLSACSANQQKGAATGAAGGALAGAAGSMMVALVFGGNVGEAAARGAVYGGTAGATAGAISGTQQDKKAAAALEQKQQKEIAKFRKQVGDDAFAGVEALLECKHEVATAYARTAARSDNKDYARAGIWLEALTLQDMSDQAGVDTLVPALLTGDKRLKNATDVRNTLQDYQQQLAQLRTQFKLQDSCGV